MRVDVVEESFPEHFVYPVDNSTQQLIELKHVFVFPLILCFRHMRDFWCKGNTDQNLRE